MFDVRNPYKIDGRLKIKQRLIWFADGLLVDIPDSILQSIQDDTNVRLDQNDIVKLYWCIHLQPSKMDLNSIGISFSFEQNKLTNRKTLKTAENRSIS